MRPEMGQENWPVEAVLGFSLVPTALVVVVGSRTVSLDWMSRSLSLPLT